MVLHRPGRPPGSTVSRRLTELQYERDVAFQRGTYRVRGDVIDVFPAESEKEAVRIGLFDDEIEEISIFDPLTGEVLNKVPRYDLSEESLRHARERVVRVLDEMEKQVERVKERTPANKLVEAQRLEQRTRFDLEMIQELELLGDRGVLRYLSGQGPGEAPPTLFDYLPDDALLILDESHVTVPQIGAMFKGDRSRKPSWDMVFDCLPPSTIVPCV